MHMQMIKIQSFEYLSSRQAHLTLVDSVILFLDVFDLQWPSAVHCIVKRLKALVPDESHPVHRENVVVPDSDPGHGLVAHLADLQQGSIQLLGWGEV